MPSSAAVEVLTKGFDLRSGIVEVTVPSDIATGQYSITRESEPFIRMKRLPSLTHLSISQSLETLETGALTSRSTRQFLLVRPEEDARLLLMTFY